MTKAHRRLPGWLTELAWLAERDRGRLCKLLELLQFSRISEITPRKCRLYEIACVRRLSHLFRDEQCRRAVEFAARVVDEPEFRHTEQFTTLASQVGTILRRELSARDGWPHREYDEILLIDYELTAYLLGTEVCYLRYLGNWPLALIRERDNAKERENEPQVALLRDIFGNPFRPVAFSPSWRTDTAVALATQMYESREFSAMPILADALQDAGCDNTDVLNHCRAASAPHVRGCWVVDLVLGKT